MILRPFVTCAALLATLLAAPLASADGPDPIELQQFEAWIGRYPDMTTEQLYEKLGVGEANTSRLPFDVRKAEFYDTVVDRLKLDKTARKRLARDGVVQVDAGRRYSMAAAYWEIFTSDLPLLVTTDSVLDAVHRSFGNILMELEQNVLTPVMRSALSTAQNRVAAMAKADPALLQSATDVDLYLTVALNLLEADPHEGPPKYGPALADIEAVSTILAKVKSLELETRPRTRIYGTLRAVDYSQFKPRGHYTKTVALQRYFRAMMWLGRADTGFEIGYPRQLRAAALITHAFDTSGAIEGLGAVRDVVDLMVGRSDELTPFQLADLMKQEKLTPKALLTDAGLDRLTTQLVASGMGQQRIASQVLVSSPTTLEKAALPPLFQLFGQRFIIDSFVMSKVVYDNIIFDGAKQLRRMPMGLDVMAALGSETALRLLRPELDGWHYAANMATVRDVLDSYDDAHWEDSLYTLWLDALRTLNTAPSGKYAPAMMKSEAWGRKTLQTQLASWAQLRHDTILYAKQSYTISIGCLYPKGYVEPYPAFYAKLGRFARTASKRFGALRDKTDPALIDRYVRYFDGFGGHMETLGGMADKQLRGERFSSEEEAFLSNTIERKMVGGYDPKPQWNGWYMDLIYYASDVEDAVKWKPTIADVHTDPNSGNVLEVGTGNVHLLVAAIDNDGDEAIHVGPTSTYYTFHQPASNRLTDPQWEAMLRDPGKTPARPWWILPHVGKATPK